MRTEREEEEEKGAQCIKGQCPRAVEAYGGITKGSLKGGS